MLHVCQLKPAMAGHGINKHRKRREIEHGYHLPACTRAVSGDAYTQYQRLARASPCHSSLVINSFFLQQVTAIVCFDLVLSAFIWVLIIFQRCFSFLYHVGLQLKTVFVLIGHWSCSARGCGVLTCFGLGVSRWWLCEPLRRSHSTLKPYNCYYNAHMDWPMKISLAQPAPCSARSLSFFFLLIAQKKPPIVFLFEKVP